MCKSLLTICTVYVLAGLLGCRAHPSSPLTEAAARGDVQLIQALLSQGADLNGKDASDWTPLIWAARKGRAEAISMLLGKGADANLPGGINGWTPLMHAIHKNQIGAVQALLGSGADANAKLSDGTTALMMAAGYGNTETVRTLLAAGADPHASTKTGLTALAVAVTGVPDIDRFTLGKCQTETVRALLEHAPDLKLPDNFWGRSALRLARWKCPEVVRSSDFWNVVEQPGLPDT